MFYVTVHINCYVVEKAASKLYKLSAKVYIQHINVYYYYFSYFPVYFLQYVNNSPNSHSNVQHNVSCNIDHIILLFYIAACF